MTGYKQHCLRLTTLGHLITKVIIVASRLTKPEEARVYRVIANQHK
jgi:hypothetical protein